MIEKEKPLEKSGILRTYDYSQFKLLEDNRSVSKNPKHLVGIKNSLMKFNDLKLKPIIVTPDMEIIDGQHRFIAAKELLLEIFYVVDNDYSPHKMIDFNTNQFNWSYEDYLNFWMFHGKSDYIKLNDLVKDTDFPLTIVMRWTSTHQNAVNRFKTGLYVFNLDQEKLDTFMSTKRLSDKLKEENFKPKRMFQQRTYVDACYSFFHCPFVERERFFDNFEIYPYKFKFCGLKDDYMNQFAEIYNHKMNRKNSIKVVSDGKRTELVR